MLVINEGSANQCNVPEMRAKAFRFAQLTFNSLPQTSWKTVVNNMLGYVSIWTNMVQKYFRVHQRSVYSWIDNINVPLWHFDCATYSKSIGTSLRLENKSAKFLKSSGLCHERSFPYHFFWTSQQKPDIEIFSWTQCEISKDTPDWHILVGNGRRIVSLSLNRSYDYSAKFLAVIPCGQKYLGN